MLELGIGDGGVDSAFFFGDVDVLGCAGGHRARAGGGGTGVRVGGVTGESGHFGTGGGTKGLARGK